MAKSKTLRIEALERRQVLASYQMPWPEIDHLTLSFVPDGTAVGTQQSALAQTLKQVFPSDDWQKEVLRAFQTWAVESNINIGLVDDGGQPLDTLGFKQGDVRFGDVRVGAFPMGADVLAVANPYDSFIANTWVGDVFLNSETNFLQDAVDPAASLYSLMLHESGHVFGIGHSADKDSPMYPQFQSIGQELTAANIATLRKLYGERKADSWEGSVGNGDSLNATPISYFSDQGELLSPSWRGDIGSNSDIDTYSIQIPAGTQWLDVRLNAAGLSLLTAKLSVLNKQGVVVATASASDPRSNDLLLQLGDLTAGEELFLRVESAEEGVFGVGAYEMDLLPRSDANAPAAPEGYSPTVALSTDPVEVLATTPGYVEHTYYEIEGELTGARTSRTYQVHSVDLAADLTNIFTVVVQAENVPVDQLVVTVTDSLGSQVPFVSIPNTRGKLALQVSDVASDQDYFITISAAGSIQSEIYYELEIDFAHDGAHLVSLANDQLDDSQPSFRRKLNVTQSQQYHFVLASSDWSRPNESTLVMDIKNASGATVYSLQVPDGAVRTGDVFLPLGSYSLTFNSLNREPSASMIFQLNALTTSSPIGPQLRDTLHSPIDSPAASPVSQLSFYWLPNRSVNGSASLASGAASAQGIPLGSPSNSEGRSSFNGDDTGQRNAERFEANSIAFDSFNDDWSNQSDPPKPKRFPSSNKGELDASREDASSESIDFDESATDQIRQADDSLQSPIAPIVIVPASLEPSQQHTFANVKDSSIEPFVESNSFGEVLTTVTKSGASWRERFQSRSILFVVAAACAAVGTIVKVQKNSSGKSPRYKLDCELINRIS